MKNPEPEAKPEDFRLLILTMAKQLTIITQATTLLLKHDIACNRSLVLQIARFGNEEKINALNEVIEDEKIIRVTLIELLKDMEKAIIAL